MGNQMAKGEANIQEPGIWHEFLMKFGPLIKSMCNKYGLTEQDIEFIAAFITREILKSQYNPLSLEKLGSKTFTSWVKIVIARSVIDYYGKDNEPNCIHFLIYQKNGQRQELKLEEARLCEILDSVPDYPDLPGIEKTMMFFLNTGISGERTAEILGVECKIVKSKN